MIVGPQRDSKFGAEASTDTIGSAPSTTTDTLSGSIAHLLKHGSGMHTKVKSGTSPTGTLPTCCGELGKSNQQWSRTSSGTFASGNPVLNPLNESGTDDCLSRWQGPPRTSDRRPSA